MTLHANSVLNTEYEFLAHPPPPKKRAKQALYVESIPSRTERRRSSTFSGIAAWAFHVQPGSPASLSPHSPHRCASPGRGDCPSITSIHSASTSFLHLTPSTTTVHVTTPSLCDFKIDLTAVGYTPIFLHLPKTPISATLSFSIKAPSSDVPNSFPNPPRCKNRSLTRFRSLSGLRSRGKSVAPYSPTKMKAKDAAASAAIIKRKKSKYCIRPPPLANELALMQFADGGSVDRNIKRIMEAQANATGTVSRGDVYHDGVGGVWLDQDEELEYVHLLAEGDVSRLHPQWVTFGSSPPPFATCVREDERRESVSTQNSELNPNHMVQPVDLLGGDDPALFGNTLAPLVTRTPSPSLLAIPSRPNRVAKHLQNPTFLIDAAFSHPRASLNSPESSNWSGADVELKDKKRKRPIPLKLSPPSPALKLPVNSSIDNCQGDFIRSSFEPTTALASATQLPISDTTPLDMGMRLIGSRTANDGSTMKTKQSVFNMKGLFRSGRK